MYDLLERLIFSPGSFTVPQMVLLFNCNFSLWSLQVFQAWDFLARLLSNLCCGSCLFGIIALYGPMEVVWGYVKVFNMEAGRQCVTVLAVGGCLC